MSRKPQMQIQAREQAREELPPIPKPQKTLLQITIKPETWIIAPIATKEQLSRWHKLGWIDDEGLHLDKAFPRNSEGKPFLLKLWIRAPLIRACEKLAKRGEIDLEKCREVVNNMEIVDENGREMNYIVINEKPLRYRKIIGKTGKTTFYEYIDSTYEIKFLAETSDPITLMKILAEAQSIGLMSGTKKGYGKFRVSVEARTTG
jgi:hypothetical protein